MDKIEGLICIDMPSQVVSIVYNAEINNKKIDINISYWHPTKEYQRQIERKPDKITFSKKHFKKELESYVVQESVSDLMDHRHTYDWVD